MKEVFGVLGIFILVICVMLGLTWVFQGNDFFMYKVFAPQYEQTRNNVFHHSQAYNDGMRTQLAKAKYEYTTAKNDNDKDAVCAYVRHDFAAYDSSTLPSDLQSFYNMCSSN